ncbi:hypothetical protein FB45DRAFT_878873 [Roridomyces roridus]|uniref:Uncharacterized protein n=1 Tax=Roridomyces roridus TaxID=1738132 RepID=A0AAD7B062_9AGAR|nr:hypothetical protein FB45DRAFT_878873 [Roridomyces roridus]
MSESTSCLVCGFRVPSGLALFNPLFKIPQQAQLRMNKAAGQLSLQTGFVAHSLDSWIQTKKKKKNLWDQIDGRDNDRPRLEREANPFLLYQCEARLVLDFERILIRPTVLLDHCFAGIKSAAELETSNLREWPKSTVREVKYLTMSNADIEQKRWPSTLVRGIPNIKRDLSSEPSRPVPLAEKVGHYMNQNLTQRMKSILGVSNNLILITSKFDNTPTTHATRFERTFLQRPLAPNLNEDLPPLSVIYTQKKKTALNSYDQARIERTIYHKPRA